MCLLGGFLELLDREPVLQGPERDVQARAAEGQSVRSLLLSRAELSPSRLSLTQLTGFSSATSSARRPTAVSSCTMSRRHLVISQPSSPYVPKPYPRLLRYDTNEPSQGFRMLVGDPMETERPANMERQNCFRCYTGPNFGGDVGAPCQDAR